MKRVEIILLIIACLIGCSALINATELQSLVQSKKLDSLRNELTHVKSDTSIVKVYLDIGSYYENENTDSAINYYTKCIQISTEIDNYKYRGKALFRIALLMINKGDYDLAIEYFYQFIGQQSKLNDDKLLPECYNNIGISYYSLGQFDKSAEAFLNALKLYEEKKDSIGISKCYNNLGAIHYLQENFDVAIDYYMKSLKIDEKFAERLSVSKGYNNIAIIYKRKGMVELAIEYYYKAITIAEETNDKKELANYYNNLSSLFLDLKRYDMGFDFISKALKIYESLNDKSGMTKSYFNIGSMKAEIAGNEKSPDLKKKYYKEALFYELKAFDLANETGFLFMEKEAAKSIMEVYYKLGDFKNAIEYAQIFIKTNDSLFNTDKINAIASAEKKFESEKKQLQIDKLNKEKELQNESIARKDAESKKQKVLMFSLLAGLILTILFFIFLYRLFVQKKKANALLALQKHQIEEIHKEVTDSINYAKLIQHALLPELGSKKNDSNLNVNDLRIGTFKLEFESFILFRPKDIVSGDFYWATEVNNYMIFTVADCTGHGVPGAFMSMLGISFLNEIVRKKEITKASEVLDQLRISVIDSLKQKGSDEEQKDGMDMSLLVIDSKTNYAQWAGANNPLWIVKSSKLKETNLKTQENSSLNLEFEACFLELKADKMPIAIYEKMDSFTNHEFLLEKGDCVYLMSDGYEDQFGGPKQKKFMSKKLKQMLLDNSGLPMFEQKEILEKTLVEWIGEGEQIDDITILGIRI